MLSNIDALELLTNYTVVNKADESRKVYSALKCL